MLNLGHQLWREIVEVVHVGPAWLAWRHTQDLGVLAGLVVHEQHAHGSRLDPDARIHRVFEQHQRVERITVAAERVGDEPIVGRVGGCREQAAIEKDPSGVVVDLVLVAAAPRNFDDHMDAALARFLCHGFIVPHSQSAKTICWKAGMTN